LVGVSNGDQVCGRTGEALQQGDLRGVSVLVLVDNEHGRLMAGQAAALFCVVERQLRLVHQTGVIDLASERESLVVPTPHLGDAGPRWLASSHRQLRQ
jgi:hypothetical protein